ncbi:MAG: hypothetical protein GX594_18125 [Pirellulaceae bacterium]|nr:hypothetical protein [Pirellulaceae bacterium]
MKAMRLKKRKLEIINHKCIALALTAISVWCASARSAEVQLPPEFTRPAPITVADVAKLTTEGVSVVEVSDYVFGNYKGELPSPPCADLNPKKAFIVFWKDFPYRFIFAHEGSYCPWFEFPSGAGICYQFFEGNKGWAELFNQWGRKERNSFVDVIEPGPTRVWVRWTYFGVNMESGEPAFRATEDFWAYPNGLILRRQTYRTLKPGEHIGYAREPIEMIGMCPVGKLWSDVLATNDETGERHALAVLDAFSTKRYDVYWKPAPTPERIWNSTRRREGCQWKELDDSPGVAMVVPFREGSAFCVLGDASGFRHDYTRIKEHSHRDTGANPWGSGSFDHWPIGWLNSQTNTVNEETLKVHPNHFAPVGMDLWSLDNEVVEQGIYYSLYGVGGRDMEPIRDVARRWLENGPAAIARQEGVAELPPPIEGKQ